MRTTQRSHKNTRQTKKKKCFALSDKNQGSETRYKHHEGTRIYRQSAEGVVQQTFGPENGANLKFLMSLSGWVVLQRTTKKKKSTSKHSFAKPAPWFAFPADFVSCRVAAMNTKEEEIAHLLAAADAAVSALLQRGKIFFFFPCPFCLLCL